MADKYISKYHCQIVGGRSQPSPRLLALTQFHMHRKKFPRDFCKTYVKTTSFKASLHKQGKLRKKKNQLS